MEKGQLIAEFKNFGFKYNAQEKPTLYDINLKIHKGEKILIAGPSGSGKSTMGHALNGLIPFAYQGEITGSLTLNGKETKDLSIFDISKIVGTVLQDSDGQFVGLTAAEDIAFAMENDCVPKDEMVKRVDKLSGMVGLDGHLSHAPSQLSGGQKQRVSMAGVLADDVDILFFDEPLANLDPATGKQAIELIEEISSETGAAVVIIEHRLEDALHRDVDRIVLVADGHIIADESPDRLLSTDFLSSNGIREPLYLSCLKYAGVNITEEKMPSSINKLRLSEEDKALVRKWYEAAGKEEKEEDAEILLDIDGLDFVYENGFHAIKGIDLKIKKGEMSAIVGTNGAGKSTFAKLVCGFEKETKGSIKLGSINLSDLSIKERADHIGYIMQNPNQMISKILIWDEIALGLETRGVSAEIIKDRVEEILKVCGLWRFRNWPVSALSYGQKKRVTIASILALSPELIILDEPTAGQDYKHYTEIMEFLKELNKKGITILMITHDMHLMLEYAGRAIVFNDGKVIADSTPADILTNKDIVEKASLKETSLYELAKLCGIEDEQDFVQRFIDFERSEARAW